MEIKFQGQYSQEVFFKAVRLANQPARNQKRFLWFMLVFALGALILLTYRVIDTRDFSGNAILLGAAVVMVIVIGGIFFQPHFTARKLWANPGVRRLLKGRVNNQGVTYTLDEGDNVISWKRIARVRLGVELVTLVRNDGLLLVFPRQFFTRDSDWRNFLKLVQKMVVNRK